ncbi:hypothetical protein BDC45DRAFT_525071 [Circinella umbellata]|nr:hypothetical protein BDC45DRAFT_525071 [Circinella umbellata]
MDIHNYITPNSKEAQSLHYANTSSDDQQYRSTSSNNNNFESITRRTATTTTTTTTTSTPVPVPPSTITTSTLSSIPENEPAHVISTTVPSITTQDMNSYNKNNSSTSQESNGNITGSNNETLDPTLLLSRFDKRKSSPAVLGLLPGIDQDQLAMHLSQQRNSIEAAMLLANLNKITTTTTPPQVSCKTEQKGTQWQDDMSLNTQQKPSWDDDLGTSIETETMRRHSYDVNMSWNTMPESFLGRSDLIPNLASSASSTENDEIVDTNGNNGITSNSGKLSWTQDGMVHNNTSSSTTGEYAQMFEFMQHPTSPRPSSPPTSLPPQSISSSFSKHSPFYYQQLPPPYPPPPSSYPPYQQQQLHDQQHHSHLQQPKHEPVSHSQQQHPLSHPHPQPMDPYYRPTYDQRSMHPSTSHPLPPPMHPYYYHSQQQHPMMTHPHQQQQIPVPPSVGVTAPIAAAPGPSSSAPRATKRKKAKVDEDEGDVVEPGDPDFPDMSERDVEAARNDPEARPRRQKMRFDDDQYTPRWVRYNGQAKEGLCDTCSPGKWLQLKNSAFWYHKQFFHGISSVSGRPFIQPVETRWVDQDLVEGLCHQCGQWVAVSNVKRKNSVLWYRHAHKCHVYHKPKSGTPKKR